MSKSINFNLSLAVATWFVNRAKDQLMTDGVCYDPTTLLMPDDSLVSVTWIVGNVVSRTKKFIQLEVDGKRTWIPKKLIYDWSGEVTL